MSKKEFVYRKEGLKLTKPDEIVVEQREDIKALRDELWLYKKALEMACESYYEETPKTFPYLSKQIVSSEQLVDYFKSQAEKEMLNEK